LVFQKLGFEVLEWLSAKLFAISIIAILVIFHPEIRQGLARLGRSNLFGTSLKEEEFDFILNQIIT
jgi:DNA integrity scanning protein DisA with diadenylate cyclase activity